MKRYLLIFAIGFPLIAGAQSESSEMEPQFPQQQTADALLTGCLSTMMSNLGRQRRYYCYGFVSGVEEGIRLTNKLEQTKVPICTPVGIRARELADAFVKYMAHHKKELEKPAAKEVYLALLHRFPCGTKDD